MTNGINMSQRKQLKITVVRYYGMLTIQTDIIEIRRPDIVRINKTKNECKIIDVACPFDSRIEEREKDKNERL